MGGNIFKDARRINKLEYDETCAVIINKTFGLSTQINIIKTYNKKEDFGDIDVLIACNSREDREMLYAHILHAFGNPEYSQNTVILSILYNNIQIDFITIESKYYNFCYNYFAYSDTGNFIGQIFHNLNMKFGQHGVEYLMRLNDYLIDTIQVTLDFREALEFIGLDYDRYVLGFDTMEEIFEYLSTSKYFSIDIYPLEHRTNTQRVRDRKRKNYQLLLKWCQQYKGTNFTFAPKQTYYDLMITSFPNIKEKMTEAWLDYGRRSLIHTKFNGEMISKLTGLKGQALGTFITHFKQMYVSKELFAKYIVNSDAEDINALILFRHSLFPSDNS